MQRMLDRRPSVSQAHHADGSITFSAAQFQFNAAELQLLEAFIKNPETFPDQVFEELLDAQFRGAPSILEQLGQVDENNVCSRISSESQLLEKCRFRSLPSICVNAA
jgi:hypothetical protein